MKKIIIATTCLVVLTVTPVLALAQSGIMDITEECCQVRAGVVWKSGKVNGQDCSADTPCEISKNMTVGPIEDGSSVGSQCSLPNSSGPIAEGTTQSVEKYSKDWSIICVIGTLNAVTNWIFFLMLALAVILSVIGGATYMTAMGDAEKATKAKSIITFAIIGLAIALVARFVPPIVRFIMGVG